MKKPKLTKKVCSKCKKSKELNKFDNDKRDKSGRYYICKECRKFISRQDYLKRRSKLLKYWNKRNKTQIAKAHRKKYKLKMKKENPIRYKAIYAVKDAIRVGKIRKRNICEICYTTENIEGHHPDYSKPLEVIWMCKKCHHKLHYPHIPIDR